MIFRFIIPVLFIPTIPVIKAILEYLIIGNIRNFMIFEAIAIFIVILFGIAGIKNYRIILSSNIITLKRGFLIRKKMIVRKQDIVAFKTSRSIFDRLFCAITCEISTEAQGKKGLVFKLYYKDGIFLKKQFYHEEQNIKIKFTLIKKMVMAAASSSFITGILISVSLIKRAESLLGIAIDEKIIKSINKTAHNIKIPISPVVNAIIIGVSAFFLLSFFIFFLKNITFRVLYNSKEITVKHGLLISRSSTFKKAHINAVITEQTFLMRLLGSCGISASIGEFGKGKGERATIIPCIKKKYSNSCASALFSFVIKEESKLKPDRTIETQNRFLFKPLIFSSLIIAVSVFLCVKFPQFGNLALSFLFVFICLVLYYADLCKTAFYKSYLAVGEETLSLWGIQGLKVKEMNCKREKVGEIRITRFPPDIWHNTCKVRITVRSKRAPTLKVLHLDYEKAKEMIFDE